MADVDTISKYLIQRYPDDFVRFSLSRDDIKVLAVLDTEQPTVKTRRTDSLLRVRIGDTKCLVHTEFQTADHTNPPMPRRMAGYIGRLVEQYGLPVYAIVIYLRPDAGRRDPGHYFQESPGHRILIEYQVIRLSEQAGQSILASGAVGLLPFAPLMQPAGQVSAAWLETCVRAVQAQPLDLSVKADCLAGMSLLSGLVYAPETVSTIFFKEGLMDLIRESPVAQYLTQQAREEGIEQGRQEGRQEGREHGSRERAMEALLDVLEIRFAVDTTDPLAARIAAIDDVQRLKQLHRAAIQVPSLEAFRRLLDADE